MLQRSPSHIHLFLATVIVAFIITVAVGGAVAWDGGYYFFRMLANVKPFTPHGRYFNFFLQLPAFKLSSFVSNVRVIWFVYGATYALVPISSFIVCWQLVRKTEPSLYVWFAICACLVMLPGRFTITSEGSMIVYVVWPLVLITILPYRRYHLFILVFYTMIGIFIHPTMMLYCATMVLSSSAMVFRYRQERRYRTFLALFFLTVVLLSVLRLTQSITEYESEQVSLSAVITAYESVFNTLVLLAYIGLVLVIISQVLVHPILLRIAEDRNLRGVKALAFLINLGELTIMFLIFLLFAIRGLIPGMWMGTLDFRTLAIFFASPMMGLAVLERLFQPFEFGAHAPIIWRHRRQTIHLVGFIFLGVLCVQSIVWTNISNRLIASMRQFPTTCVSASSISWLEATPLNHWTVTSYSLLLQGQYPEQFITTWDHCNNLDFSEGLPMTNFDVPLKLSEQSMLQLQPLLDDLRIEADRSTGTICDYGFTANWYWVTERDGIPTYRTHDTGIIGFNLDYTANIKLTGSMAGFIAGNPVTIVLDGREVSTVVSSLEVGSAVAFEVFVEDIAAGSHQMSFITTEPAIVPIYETRMIAFELSEVAMSYTITTDDIMVTGDCAFIP